MERAASRPPVRWRCAGCCDDGALTASCTSVVPAQALGGPTHSLATSPLLSMFKSFTLSSRTNCGGLASFRFNIIFYRVENTCVRGSQLFTGLQISLAIFPRFFCYECLVFVCVILFLLLLGSLFVDLFMCVFYMYFITHL